MPLTPNRPPESSPSSRTPGTATADNADEIKKRIREWEAYRGQSSEVGKTIELELGGQTIRIEVKVIGKGGSGPQMPPADGLQERLQTAFQNDKVAVKTKDEARKTLVKVYQDAAGLPSDRTLKNADELYRKWKTLLVNAISSDDLPATQTLIVTEVEKVVQNKVTLLTEQNRTDAKELFTQIAKALENLR